MSMLVPVMVAVLPMLVPIVEAHSLKTTMDVVVIALVVLHRHPCHL